MNNNILKVINTTILPFIYQKKRFQIFEKVDLILFNYVKVCILIFMTVVTIFVTHFSPIFKQC